MMYLGDYHEDETVHFLWSTCDAAGASITRATDGTVSVYKDNGTTQSVAGVTDTEDFDSLTGVHACAVDLSADAFYATGADYSVVVSAMTVDGQVINTPLAHFSIENRWVASGNVVLSIGPIRQSTAIEVIVGPFLSIVTGEPLTSLTVAGITSGIIKHGSPPTNTAITWAAAASNHDMVHLANGYWRCELTTTDTNTLGAGSLTFRDDDVFRPVTCRFVVVTANEWDSKCSTDKKHVDVIEYAGQTATTSTGNLPDINVAEISDDSAAADSLEGAIDNANDVVAADVTKISGDTAAANALESYCDGSTAQPVDVQEVDGTALNATDLAYLMTATESFTVDTTINAATTTVFESSCTEATADHYNDGRILFVAGALKGQRKNCTDYRLNGGKGEFTVDALTEAPGNGDRFIII